MPQQIKNSFFKNKNRLQNLFSRISTAWFVLVISLLATIWSTFIIRTLEQQQTKSNIFDFRTERIKNAMTHRMQAYQQILKGGAALFAASTSVDRQQWHKYVSHLHLDKEYPGIQGMGFTQVIHPQEKAAHLAKIREEGGLFLHYTLRPEGERELYTSIIYLEPLDRRNQQAIGYDMFSEPIRRAAMEQARDTGEPALSGKVKLIQEIDQDVQAGCLMYIPVYRHGQPHNTLEEKRSALIGYVYSPFRMRDLMQGIFGGNQPSGIDFHIYDGKGVHTLHSNQLMYDETPKEHLSKQKLNYSPQFTKIEQLEIAGHIWTIEFVTLPQFDVTTKTYMAEIVWSGGMIISFLLFGVTRSLEMARVLTAQQRVNALLQTEIFERKQINLALQESQKQLRLITDNVPAFIAYVDAKQTYRFVNKHYEEWFGLPRHHIVGQEVKQIIGETAYEGEIKKSIEAALSGQSVTFEAKLPHQDHDNHWVHGKYFPDLNSAGKVMGYFALVIDITERKRAEETIQEQHAHLLSILENTEDVICLRDREGKLMFHNTAFAKIVRKLFNLEPFIGMNTLKCLPQEAQNFWKPILAQVLRGERYQGEFSWNFGEGDIRHYEIFFNPIWKGNSVIGYSEYTMDITQRKQAEEKLRLQSEIVENMSEGTCLIRAQDGIIIYTNHTFDLMFGYASKELIGKHISTINAPTDKNPVEIAQEMRQHLNDATGLWQSEVRNLRQDGSTFWCHVNVSSFEHPHHGHIWVAIHQDISDRKKVEENLRESEEKYRILLEHAGLGIAYYDLTGRTLLFNQIAASNMGGQPKDFVGKFIHEIFSDDIAQRAMDRIKATVASETPLEFEDYFELSQGTFWFSSTFAKIQDGTGKTIGIQTISQNITERKRMEAQLQYDAKVNTALADLSKSLLAPITHLREISDQTLAVAQWLTQSEHGYVSFIEPTTGNNVSYTLTSMIEKECTLPKEVQRIVFERLPDGTYPRLWGHALNIRKGFYTNDPARHEKAEGIPHGHLQLQGFLSVPALLEETLVGQISLANPSHPYTDLDLAVIEQVAVIYASALQRKRIEIELSEEKQFSDDIINSLPGIFYMLNESGRFVRWNPRFSEVTGYSDAEIAGKQAIEVIEENDRSIIAERVQEVFKNGEAFAEVALLTKYGETIPYHFTGRRTRVKDCAYLVGLGEDITERKRAEEELREARDFAEQVIETANVMAIGLNLQGQIIIYNSAAEMMTGYRYAEVKGQNWFELIVPRDRYPKVWEVFNRLNQHEPIFTFENPILTKSGEERFISWRNSTLRKKGQIIGTFSFGVDITDRKRAEEALLTSERKYRMLADFTFDWEFWQGTDGHYIYISPACERISGFKPEQFQNNPNLMREIIHPEDQTSYDQHVLTDQNPQWTGRSIEFRLISRTGEIRWINHVCHAVFDTEGHPLGRRGNNRDITERKQVEMEREEYFKFFQSASDLMCVTGLDYHFKKVNPAFIKTLGYTQEELYSHSYLDFVHPEDRHKTIKDKEVAFSPEGTMEFENRYLSKGGKVVWLSWSAKPSPDGKVIYATARNITERKHIEELLRANECLLTNAVRITHLGTFEWNLLDNSNIWSEEFFHIFGIPNTVQPSHEIFLCAIHPEDRDTVTQALEFALVGLCPYEAEYRIVLPNGELRYVQSQGEIQRNKAGQAQCLMGTVLDITERKQMELHLQRAKEVADAANRAKSTFLANMSHELRTPLNGILGYAQILSWKNSLTEEQREGIGVIKQSGEYLLTLINDILDLAKIEAGKIELIPSTVFLNGFLQEVVQLFQMRAQQKNILFSYQTLSKLPTALHADEKHLRQILINLLGNAIKFTTHGSITLKVSYIEDALQIQIEDTGVGMAEKDLEKIFLPFQQVGDQKARQQGTGLGLSITKNLVEMMGGHLQVSSTLGQGSTFWMSLKLPKVTEELPAPHEELLRKIIGYQGHPRTVLVIDDDELNRSLLSKILMQLGFIVLEAPGGQAGLDKAQEDISIDLIVVDLVMPDIDGFAVIHQLRRMPHRQKTILITVSASAFEADRQRSLAMGSHDFIPKPINLEFLLERLGVHLKLTWCYETSTGNPLSSIEDAFPQGVPSFELTLSQATELFDLVMCGDVMGLSDYAKYLEKTNDRLVEFARYILKLTQRFDIEEIAELVKPFLEKK